jgi:hypothetical protein
MSKARSVGIADGSHGSVKGAHPRGWTRQTTATPPTEIRLFKAGINQTTKGEFLFDEKAAEMVMAASKAWGIDHIIDLEHLSLDPEARHFNTDALGHFNLDVRDGELWAVNVRWNADGLRRLSEKTQRYVSPAFFTDDTGRITEVVNIALVAMPATHGAPALVAATRGTNMKLRDYKSVSALIATLSARAAIANAKMVKLADEAPAEGAPAGKAASMKSAAETVQTAIADLLDKAEGNDIDAVFAAMDAAVKAMDACENAIGAMTGAPMEPPAEATPAPDAAASVPTDKQLAFERAKSARLQKELDAERHEKEVARLAAQAEKRALVERSLSGRLPPPAMKLLAKLSLEELELFSASVSALPVVLGGPRPPAGAGGVVGDGSKQITTSSGVVVTLTANQLRECERTGAKPEAFAELQARRTVKA